MKNYLKNFFVGIVAICAITLISGLSFHFSADKTAEASVPEGGAYNATTTDPTWLGSHLVKTGHGVLGSVVVTNSSASCIRYYDATTTDISQRNNQATSTITLASFCPSVVVGTYTFDVAFTKGLIIDPILGGVGIASTTNTYR